MRTRAGNIVTIFALAISLGWGYLLGFVVLRNNRPNAWYDMDFSVWVLCVLYAFIHMFIGKLWTMGITGLLNVLEKRLKKSLLPLWTEDRQIIFGSLWPISVPIGILVFLFLMTFSTKAETE